MQAFSFGQLQLPYFLFRKSTLLREGVMFGPTPRSMSGKVADFFFSLFPSSFFWFIHILFLVLVLAFLAGYYCVVVSLLQSRWWLLE